MRMAPVVPFEQSENNVAGNDCCNKEKNCFNEDFCNSATFIRIAYSKDDSKRNESEYVVNYCGTYDCLSNVAF